MKSRGKHLQVLKNCCVFHGEQKALTLNFIESCNNVLQSQTGLGVSEL